MNNMQNVKDGLSSLAAMLFMGCDENDRRELLTKISSEIPDEMEELSNCDIMKLDVADQGLAYTTLINIFSEFKALRQMCERDQ